MSVCFFFFKQKTAYEMRISDWSSDVCSSDLEQRDRPERAGRTRLVRPDRGLWAPVGAEQELDGRDETEEAQRLEQEREDDAERGQDRDQGCEEEEPHHQPLDPSAGAEMRREAGIAGGAAGGGGAQGRGGAGPGGRDERT